MQQMGLPVGLPQQPVGWGRHVYLLTAPKLSSVFLCTVSPSHLYMCACTCVFVCTCHANPNLCAGRHPLPPPHPLDLYGRDLVRAIIQVKWESYARAFLLMQVRSCVRVPCRGPEALLL